MTRFLFASLMMFSLTACSGFVANKFGSPSITGLDVDTFKGPVGSRSAVWSGACVMLESKSFSKGTGKLELVYNSNSISLLKLTFDSPSLNQDVEVFNIDNGINIDGNTILEKSNPIGTIGSHGMGISTTEDKLQIDFLLEMSDAVGKATLQISMFGEDTNGPVKFGMNCELTY